MTNHYQSYPIILLSSDGAFKCNYCNSKFARLNIFVRPLKWISLRRAVHIYVKLQIKVMSGWVGLKMTSVTLCWNDVSTFSTDRYPFVTTFDVILVGGLVRDITLTCQPGQKSFLLCTFSYLALKRVDRIYYFQKEVYYIILIIILIIILGLIILSALKDICGFFDVRILC